MKPPRAQEAVSHLRRGTKPKGAGVNTLFDSETLRTEGHPR